MEDISNVSSEEELLQLREEGKISEDEYEELRSAMRKSTKLDAEPPQAATDKTKSKHKLAKIAFTLMLTGLILPALAALVGYGLTMIMGGVQREAMPIRVSADQKLTKSTNTENLRKLKQRIDELKRATEAKSSVLVAMLAVCFFLCVALEIVAFALGVIAWPDVLGKATVATISVFTVLLILFTT